MSNKLVRYLLVFIIYLHMFLSVGFDKVHIQKLTAIPCDLKETILTGIRTIFVALILQQHIKFASD